MAGNTEDLLDKLSDLLQKAFSLPFGADRCIVDRDKVLGLIDEIRNVMPPEIEQAVQIVQRANDLTSDAKREAALIRRQAEERALAMVNESKIVLDAKDKAHEIEAKALQREHDLRRLANDYVEDTLKRLDETMTRIVTDHANSYQELQKVRAQFHRQVRADSHAD